MRKILITSIILFGFTISHAQSFTKANDDNVIIYFVRSSLNSAGRNINFFDNEKIIGSFKGKKSYMVYECQPGPHLFSFAVNESRADYLSVNLQKGKTYIASVNPGFGKLVPYIIDPNDKSILKDMWKIIGKNPPKTMRPEKLKEKQYKYNYFIDKKLQEYEVKLKNGESFEQDINGLELPDKYLKL